MVDLHLLKDCVDILDIDAFCLEIQGRFFDCGGFKMGVESIDP